MSALNNHENKPRVAVVLHNLGGPDSLEAVRPFLFNLFKDKAIINLPQPFRYILAWVISRLRTPKAKKIYEKLGGKSPLLENTEAQRLALTEMLQKLCPQVHWQTFIAMRYWHPFTQEAVQDVKKFAPESIILLPLYPQFSTTTSESSFNAWIREMKNQGLTIPVNFIGCYPKEPGFIKAMQGLLAKELDQIDGPVRILFSAHGLPQKVVDDGDPYAVHVNLSVTEVMNAFPHLDYQVCYQSKVGKLKWLEPSLNDEIERAAHDRVGVLIVPISFVSEHSETLVELDMDFAQRAQELNLPFYGRTPTVSCHPLFIQGLAEQVVRQTQGSQVSCNVCPPSYHKCWCRAHG